MNIRMLLLPLALILSTGLAIADADVGTAPLPDWVDRLDLEGFTEDRSGQHMGGIAYLLLDRQVTKTDVGFDYAQRLAYEVLDRRFDGRGRDPWSAQCRARDRRAARPAFSRW